MVPATTCRDCTLWLVLFRTCMYSSFLSPKTPVSVCAMGSLTQSLCTQHWRFWSLFRQAKNNFWCGPESNCLFPYPFAPNLFFKLRAQSTCRHRCCAGTMRAKRVGPHQYCTGRPAKNASVERLFAHWLPNGPATVQCRSMWVGRCRPAIDLHYTVRYPWITPWCGICAGQSHM